MITKEELKEKYINWFTEEITVKDINESIEITTPLMDRFNDYLQIYVTLESDNKMRLTDDGYIIENLKSSGVDLNTEKRKQLIEMILKKYSILLSDNELYVYTNMENFPQVKFNLLQAMLNIDDMFMLLQNRVMSTFLEDINCFFEQKNIYSVPNVMLTGKTGLSYVYDYIIQKNKNNPERLCKIINNATRSNMESTLFAWNDTKENRNEDSKLIVFLNDNNKIENGIEEAFKQYDASVIKWSERDKKENLRLLTA